MRGLRTLLVTALAASTMAACTAESGGDDEASDVALGEAAVTSLDPNGAQSVAITEPAALRDLEKRGFGFGHHFGTTDDVRADILEATPGWSSIAHGIASGNCHEGSSSSGARLANERLTFVDNGGDRRPDRF